MTAIIEVLDASVNLYRQKKADCRIQLRKN